jgi:hypothetical protein
MYIVNESREGVVNLKADETHLNPVEFERISLFGNYLNCADRRIVHSRGEIQLDLALCRGLYVVESLKQGGIAGLSEDVEFLQQHFPVARDVEYPASNTADPTIADAEPSFQEVQS